MDIESIDKKTFDDMLLRVNSLNDEIKTIYDQRKSLKLGKWLDGQEVCLILKISPRTLQTYRETGKIGYSQINYKIYYKPEDVNKLLMSSYINNKDHK